MFVFFKKKSTQSLSTVFIFTKSWIFSDATNNFDPLLNLPNILPQLLEDKPTQPSYLPMQKEKKKSTFEQALLQRCKPYIKLECRNLVWSYLWEPFVCFFRRVPCMFILKSYCAKWDLFLKKRGTELSSLVSFQRILNKSFTVSIM